MSSRQELICVLRQAAASAIAESDREGNAMESLRLHKLGVLLSGEARGLESMQERRLCAVVGL